MAGWMSYMAAQEWVRMDIGYVILLLLVLVHGATAAFLYWRAQQKPAFPEEAQEMPPEEPEVS